MHLLIVTCVYWQVAEWFMQRSMWVDRMTGNLSMAAMYLQEGLQGGYYEGDLESCKTPLEAVLLELQSAACAGT